MFNNQLSGEKKTPLFVKLADFGGVNASTHLVSSYKPDVSNFKVGKIGT